jgi:branched-chain amino acid transport system permease protein
MHEFLEFTIIGIVLGATYAVAASGLVLTYSTSGIFNIAHGAIGMFMAFVYWQLSVPWHLAPGLAFAITVFVLAPLFGALIERILIRRVATANVTVTLVITVGLTLVLIGLAQRSGSRTVAGGGPVLRQRRLQPLSRLRHLEEVITIGIAIAIAIGLRLLLFRTRVGIAMRGVVDNRELIGLFGGRPSLSPPSAGPSAPRWPRWPASWCAHHPAGPAHPDPAGHRRLRGGHGGPPAQPALTFVGALGVGC